MSDLIRREALLKELATHFNNVDGRTLYHPSMALAMHDVRNAPAVDAVEVVRCKDCEWGGKCEVECLLREIDKIADPYCAAGKRREENAEKT